MELGGRVEFAEPAPKRLSLEDAPDYHWVDGARHRSARMDYAASGYVGVERCATCSRQWYDITASKPRDFPVVSGGVRLRLVVGAGPVHDGYESAGVLLH